MIRTALWILRGSEGIAAMLYEHVIRPALFCLDAAQSAGVLPISLKNSCIDYLCTAGHKGLYGPMGTGLLLINTEKTPDSLFQGGTGSFSSDRKQPDILPDKFESGTPNLPGIAGLNEGIRFVLSRGVNNIEDREMRLAQRLYDGLKRNREVVLYTQRPQKHTHVPVISFNLRERDSEEIAALLSDRYNIAVRAGLHCAPLAHEQYSTQYSGTIRAVMSAFSNEAQVQSFLYAVNKISKNAKK